MDNYNEGDDMVVDYDSDPETGEPKVDGFGRPKKKVKRGPKPEGRNKIAMRIAYKFMELCKKEVGVTPMVKGKGYTMALQALNEGGLTEEQIYDLFDEWFGLGKPDEETVQITRALSANQVNAYKARNQI